MSTPEQRMMATLTKQVRAESVSRHADYNKYTRNDEDPTGAAIVWLIAFILLALLAMFVYGFCKFHEKKVVAEARAEERVYVMSHWDKVVADEIRYRARKELSEGAR